MTRCGRRLRASRTEIGNVNTHCLFIAGVDVYQGAQWAVVSSPLLVTLLLTAISGIPMLEARADARFANDANYQAYKARTPVLVPRPPRTP